MQQVQQQLEWLLQAVQAVAAWSSLQGYPLDVEHGKHHHIHSPVFNT
jgi:hypothetical protein